MFLSNDSVAIDMWSLGCILVEMHTGEPLFSGTNELDQIIKIAEVMGSPPHTMLKLSPKAKEYFRVYRSSNLADEPVYKMCRKNKATGEEEVFDVARSRNLEQIIGVHLGGPGGRRAGQEGHDVHHYKVFLDLVSSKFLIDESNGLSYH
jgi:dual specificity tyrosine-phosphorylation-regulated kinase 1